MSIIPIILGTGSYHPPRVVKNKDLEVMLDTSDEWIKQRTGIEQRYYCEAKDSTTSLGLIAAQRALVAAGLRAEDLDLIIFATVSPDHEFPGSGCFLAGEMSLPGITAIDVRQQCSGFLFGLSLAQQYIKTETYKKILLVGAEVHSKCLDMTPRGRDISVLFGDGAGAVILGAGELSSDAYPRVVDVLIGCDGTKARDLWCPAPGTGLNNLSRMTAGMIEEGLQYPKMNGRSIFQSAVMIMTAKIKEITARNGISPEKLDKIIIHQANQRIGDAIAQQLNLAPEKFFNTVHRYGNTTAASIPLGLDDAVRAGVLDKGMKVGFAAFGSGFTFGAAYVRW
jgi:3-oxoacyl-[acyl-carrier-protein] synthase-3